MVGRGDLGNGGTIGGGVLSGAARLLGFGKVVGGSVARSLDLGGNHLDINILFLGASEIVDSILRNRADVLLDVAAVVGGTASLDGFRYVSA